jgi:hypothetical protein
MLLLIWLLQDPYAKAIQDGLHLPDLTAYREKHAKAVSLIESQENWTAALRTIDQRTGRFGGGIDIKVSIQSLPQGELAHGWGEDGKGIVQIDIDKLTGYLGRMEEFARRDPNSKVRLGPISPQAILTHEMAHCFQNRILEPWLSEGFAVFAARDPYFLHYYTWVYKDEKEIPVPEIEKTPTDKNLHYGRGMAFFEYLQAKGCVKEFIRRITKEGEGYQKAASELLGKPWADVVQEEHKWSSAFILKHR